jgi:coatomer subunit beta'
MLEKSSATTKTVLEQIRVCSEISRILEQIRVCSEISIDCMETNPEKRPTTQRIIDLLEKTECRDEFNETDFNETDLQVRFYSCSHHNIQMLSNLIF